MKKPFRVHHLLALLNDYERQHLPLDVFISHYFQAHKALGPKDRAYIAETAYRMIRWRSLLDYICGAPYSWDNRYASYQHFDPGHWLNKAEIPLHVRLSFPKVLFDLFVDSYGVEEATLLCLASNHAAPTTVRINALKTTREEILSRWAPEFSVEPCTFSPYGVNFLKKIAFFSHPDFKAGFFEVQDEGSQLVSALVKAAPGQLVLDYCAGSGGKALAIAPGMDNKGQLFLHDIRPFALEESRKRLRRAGIQNAQIVGHDDPKLKKMKKKMDWVLVDVPCTGTGTMRRNPDMKWKFAQESVDRLVGQQRMIFEKALSFMRPEGCIVYATCSLLKQENEDQLEHFIRTYPLEVVGDVFKSKPVNGGMDGFFGVVLKHKKFEIE